MRNSCKAERLAILDRRALAGQIQGERRSPKRGQSVEFADYRPYASGMISGVSIGMLTHGWNDSSSSCLSMKSDLTASAGRFQPLDGLGEPNKLEYAIRLLQRWVISRWSGSIG
jgi:hypothetical protein